MRPGRVNTYHNDPFVAAPANNGSLLHSRFQFFHSCAPVVLAGVVLNRIISESLFHPRVYLPAAAPSISDRSLRRFASERPVLLGRKPSNPPRLSLCLPRLDCNFPPLIDFFD